MRVFMDLYFHYQSNVTQWGDFEAHLCGNDKEGSFFSATMPSVNRFAVIEKSNYWGRIAIKDILDHARVQKVLHEGRSFSILAAPLPKARGSVSSNNDLILFKEVIVTSFEIKKLLILPILLFEPNKISLLIGRNQSFHTQRPFDAAVNMPCENAAFLFLGVQENFGKVRVEEWDQTFPFCGRNSTDIIRELGVMTLKITPRPLLGLPKSLSDRSI